MNAYHFSVSALLDTKVSMSKIIKDNEKFIKEFKDQISDDPNIYVIWKEDLFKKYTKAIIINRHLTGFISILGYATRTEIEDNKDGINTQINLILNNLKIASEENINNDNLSDSMKEYYKIVNAAYSDIREFVINYNSTPVNY